MYRCTKSTKVIYFKLRSVNFSLNLFSAMEKKLMNCLEKIMTNVEEIKVQMHLNTQLLQATMTKVDGIETRSAVGAQEIDSEIQLDVCFPLETQDDVEKLEDILQEREKSKSLVCLNCYSSVVLKTF